MKRIIMTDRIRQLVDFELFPEDAEVEIATAYSNEDAFHSHERKRADLILVELYRAGMNATQFCSRIRESEGLRRVSVIVCCRPNDIELAESARCRANAVLTVPFEPSDLRRTMNRLLTVPARSEYRAHFSARALGHGQRRAFACEIGNISVSGMLIEAGAELKPGDRITCSLALPAASFDTQLEIVRAARSASPARNRYGVRFSRLDPSARTAIELLVGHGA